MGIEIDSGSRKRRKNPLVCMLDEWMDDEKAKEVRMLLAVGDWIDMCDLLVVDFGSSFGLLPSFSGFSWFLSLWLLAFRDLTRQATTATLG